jgi:hypothetical protein
VSETDWKTVPARLKASGFTVFYDRISYEPERPLWCARANRDGREWRTLGRDLETALLELDRQTHEGAIDWRAVISRERAGPATTSQLRETPGPTSGNWKSET